MRTQRDFHGFCGTIGANSGRWVTGMAFCDLLDSVRKRVRALFHAKRGNVAMTFALALIPIAIAAGTGVDFSRALLVRSRLAEALDAAGLAVGAKKGLTQAEIQQLAQSYFNANYTADSSFGVPAALTITPGNQTVTLSTSVVMPTTLMNVAGIKNLDIGYTTEIVWGQTKLWVALVLDNTGSMSETDGTGTSKIDALKNATHQLLTMLQNAATNPGDVKVSIVPFSKDVNVDPSNYTKNWLDWTAWDNAQGTCAGGRRGNPRSRNQCISNGGTWTPLGHNRWNGCVWDRVQDNDTKNTVAVPNDSTTLFDPEQYAYCPIPLEPLTYDWTALGNEVDAMTPNGNTNQTIGLVWGWQTMTDGDPMNSGPLPAQTQRVIILLSDGLNTQNRWTTSQASIDAREELACDHVKADGVTIYSVFVDLNGTSGNSAPLQYCASDASKYFDLTTSGEIVTAFNTIGEQITNLRVAK